MYCLPKRTNYNPIALTMVLISIYVVTIVLMLGTNKAANTTLTQSIHEQKNSSVLPQVAVNP